MTRGRLALLWVVGFMLASSSMVAVSPVAVAAPGDAGVFSVRCVFSHNASDDPIVSPGRPGEAHGHEFFANRSTNASSTYGSMLAGGTTCPLTGDTAAYWYPSLMAPDGTRVPPVQVLAYYRSAPTTDTQTIPADLRMIAGGNTNLPPAPILAQRSLSWSCVDTGPFSTTPPNCGKKQIKAHVHFPWCWDGANLDSADHRSHMAYGSSGRTCPATHPVMLPRLTLHVTYGVKNATGYMLASDEMFGLPAGTSLHADFWQTWDQGVLDFLVNRCLRGGESCKDMTDQKLAALGSGVTPVS